MANLPRKDREEQKYVYLENVLQDVNRKFIALNEEEKRRNNVILNEVLVQIIEKMKKKSKLFATMYRKEFCGGSYFDNLKVGKPDEYDLDLLLTLPKFAEPLLEISDIPGSVHIRLENLTGFLRQPYSVDFPDLAKKLLDEYHYLSTHKVLRWIESVLTIAVNEFSPLSAQYWEVKHIDTSHGIFYFTVRKQGPAFTLKLNGTVNDKAVKIDIDLVPCFVFPSQKWPREPYRKNPVPEKSEFFVVPKEPKACGSIKNIARYWRLSFQEQEGVLISSLQNLKPALRLLKKLRDSYFLPYIASYYLKTIFLLEVEENRTIWNKPLSYVFMRMLKKYQQYIESGEIPYFWNEHNNLISRVNSQTLFNLANMLQHIIQDVESHPDDPKRIMWYLTKVIPESAVHDYWSEIKDLPENNPQGSRCILF